MMFDNLIIGKRGVSGNYLTPIIICEQSGIAFHAAQMSEAIAIGYGIDNSGSKSNYTINSVTYNTSLNVYTWVSQRIIFQNNMTTPTCLDYAKSIQVRMVVCSDTGFSGKVIDYDAVQLFYALGSDSFVRINVTPECNVITSGSSKSDPTKNGTGYGNALSFFSTYNTSSSDSNAFTAGQMLYIKEQRSIAAGYETSWWDTRYACMQTASDNPSFPLHDLFNGWGKINIAAAIAYSGSVPPDPYPQS